MTLLKDYVLPSRADMARMTRADKLYAVARYHRKLAVSAKSKRKRALHRYFAGKLRRASCL